MLTPTTFYFLRHGETDWNRNRLIQGQTDVPLNDLGLSQAESVRAAVEALPIATICCSPLLRTRRTMEIVNCNIKKPVVLVPELMEVGLGEIQGQASNGEWRAPWVKGELTPPGGETFLEYVARILRGLTHSLTQPGPVLMVGHGGNFWALEHYGLIDSGTRVSNCSLFRVDPPGDSKFWTVTQLACPDGPALAIGEGAAP